ncbi:immune inhibitor A domain-containing protein [Nocardioides deserti]|uniref:Immune inhibitor A n=1 Tax=Nocardioides deserti TaxID=1588644 RepID=A0ABR6U9W5_9ACTN|nr:immune inhibitor A domain-containing protein [Nocardioides deserti]MBC2961229.1 immune inhibitor A [Nocardioides deserti]GGO72128.1 protease [Nocardioides deserti]
MNRRTTSVLGVAAALGLAAGAVAAPATATPAADPDATTHQTAGQAKADDRPDPLETKRRAGKARATELVVTGQAKPQDRGGSKAVKVAPGQWVEYGTQETAQLLSFLVDFGDQVDPRFPAEGAGPRHGQIEEPGEDDNSTYWRETFDRSHFMDMFFHGMPEEDGASFRQVYDEMSSGRFDVEGDVSDWVTVPYNSASYGMTESNQDMSRFISDTATAWVESQRAEGKSDAEIEDYLKRFDVWDRFDHDQDGDFAEPDGYVDHFQAIHAGEGEEAGAPESAIWSHRWAVRPTAPVGPEGAKLGGVEIGDTGIWIRDYTTEPENGGLGVFAHEFAHDLGLPDYYDTNGGENGTAFWTLMSSGSWLSHADDDAIGTRPNSMGPHEKLLLGWLDHATVRAGQSAQVKLGPAHHATKSPQAVLVNLPNGTTETEVGPAASGSRYLYSGNGDDRTATATSPTFTVPEGATLTAKVDYQIEVDWDYAYAEISTDGGSTFTPLATNLSTDTDPNGQNDGHGITGSSQGQWVDLSADLAAYAGEQAQVRFRMFNDAAYHELGLKVDDVAVGSALTTGFEDGDEAWTRDGFVAVEDGSYTEEYTHYYLAENRQYAGYDTTLAEGPYNFGWGVSAPDRVERFPYQNGMLVWYVNGLFADNNTSQHPGAGEALPVDADATALRWSDGTLARNRIGSFDATFGLGRTDPISLHRETAGGMTTLDVPSRQQSPVFDDSDPDRYYDPANPQGSVRVAGSGTTIRVVNSNEKQGVMTVRVN